MELTNIRNNFHKKIEGAQDLEALEILRIKYLGRKGIVADLLNSLKNLPEGEKKQKGQEINSFKKDIEQAFEKKAQIFQNAGFEAEGSKWFDITRPGTKHPKGHFHPRTIVLCQVETIFQSMGFSIVDGPELETDWYNFEALNIPKDHPARDMQDTFYVPPIGESLDGEDLVMRTHTSPMQVRYMEKNTPPLRIIVPGRVFRRESTDASHDYQFYQIEGLMVDKHISVANFKAVITEFFSRFFGQKVAVRLRPSYFPFTEPSFEIDISCVFCDEKGCRICAQGGWLEIAGAGMVNQKVFESAGYARNEWQGFAFGFGLDRLAMMKYKIDDIRLLNSGDLRFLRQF
jgi:phenylalanyl-tRNA synthetase alpha chain